MSGYTILAVAGCRPNFVKLGPLFGEMRRWPHIKPLLLHTGQHYDSELSGVFFRDLGLPQPDVFLQVGSGSHAIQTARAMEGIEIALQDLEPDLVLVVGDVNSTLAAALTATKLGFPVAHVEAGLRSFDREMPEEINRITTDSLSDLLFATERKAVTNLVWEGVPADKVHFVGNVMVDALLQNLDRIAASDLLQRLALAPGGYAALTLHRPDNVGDGEAMAGIVDALARIQRRIPIVFPVHPRARGELRALGIWDRLAGLPNLLLTDPLGYLDFLKLVKDSALVLTDSGGVQEESTVLRVPCLTLRESTERPATVLEGSNRIVGRDPEAIVEAAFEAMDGRWSFGCTPEKWDGMAAARIVEVLLREEEPVRSLYQGLRRRRACRRASA
jgi:UDP-N-acetylglucosamine 2-epimerase (non-hydrolysing)